MFYKNKQNLPPMKYFKGQEVKFNFGEDTLQGVIDILDFGGALEHDYHSYDIYVEADNTLYKHIPEVDVSRI